jgi:uncharacterized protein involved in exopolysaccharide biosynthesis
VAAAHRFPQSNDNGAFLRERLAVLRRRREPAIVALLSVLALALVVALVWPRTYRSSGTVLIEQQEIPDELVRAAITSYADQRVRTISQRVMTTANLLDIVRRYDLYPDVRSREPREKTLERMRNDIGLEMISADVVDPRQGRPTKATIAFMVSYDSESPMTAARVANELTTLYLNENLESRRKLAAGTAGFLQEEVVRVGSEVADLERLIAEFKTRHADAMPDLSQINIQLMSRADEELRDAQARATSLDQQIVYLDAQLAQIEPVSASFADGKLVPSANQRLKALRAELASATALYGPGHPDVRRLNREVEGLEREVGQTASANELARRLGEARLQLAEAKTRYSATHPDVLRLERTIDSIEQALRSSSLTAGRIESSEQPDNPAYIQIKAQREAALNERASVGARIAAMRGRIGDYEDRLARAPAVEREYSALVRELQGAQLKYQEVRQKQMEAQVASNLESEQKGEKFTLIDPPLVPEKPHSPRLALLAVLGVALAIGAALLCIVVLEQLDTSIRGRRNLTDLLTVPPLAAIPVIETDRDIAARRKTVRRIAAAAVGGLAVLLLTLHFAMAPLDVLWHALLRRFGF